MNKKEFIEEVQTHCPPELVQHVPMAVGLLEGIIKYERWDVPRVIQFIPRMLSLMQSTKGEDYLSGGKLNAHALLTSDSLAELLKPEIKAIRKTYFGSGEPPFGSFKEAERWLEPIEVELMERAGLVAVYGYHENELPEFSSKEAEMWDEVQEKLFVLSGETGISSESLGYYVLADIKPLSLPYEVRMPGREYCKGRRKCFYVDIKVYTELGFEELLEIYHTVKGALGVKKGKRFKERHLELYAMVQERGGAPQRKGTVVIFWKCLQEEWNQRHRNGRYTTWKGIQRAYDLIYKKLNAQYQT
ncbi:MAG: hypothetical protein NTW48_04190 [Chloroflexi bacterium]|nr:hypothetical protein [Chloroflexota bacterium]